MKKNKPKINKNKYIPKYNLGGYSTPEGTFNADGTQITGPYGSAINNTDAYNTAAPMIMDAGYATNDAIKLNDTSNKAYRKEDNADIGGQVAAAGTGAVGGAAAGAKIGAAIGGTAGTAVGPAGTVAGGGAGALIGGAIGGVVGGASGFFKKRSQDKKQWKAEQEQENQQMLAAQNKPMYAQPQPQQPQLMPQQYSQQPGFYARNGGMMKYRNGGEIPAYNPNKYATGKVYNQPFYNLTTGENNNSKRTIRKGIPDVSNLSGAHDLYSTKHFRLQGDGQWGGGLDTNDYGDFDSQVEPYVDIDTEDVNWHRINQQRKIDKSNFDKKAINNQQTEPLIAKYGGTMKMYNSGTMKYPHGGETFTQFNEPSHEQQNPNVENIPGGQVELDENMVGNKIYSAKLKPIGSKKSFADLNKVNAPKETDSKFITDFKLKNSERIFQSQEQLKADKVAKYAKKMGIEYNPNQNNQEMMVARNGGVKQYETGGEKSDRLIYERDLIRANAEGEAWNASNNVNTGINVSTYKKDLRDANAYGDDWNERKRDTNQSVYDRDLEEANAYGEAWNESKNKNRDYSNLLGLTSLAGPVTGLLTNKPQTPVNYQSASYIPMDPSAELRANANAAAIGRNMLKQNAQGAGSYLSNISAQNAANREANAATLTKYSNINTQGYNRAAEAKADAANRSMDATAADQARTRDLKTKYIGDIGTGVAKLAIDEKETQQDYKTLGMISSLYPDYKYNKKTGEWRHKNSNVKLSQEEINKIYK